MNSSSQHVIFGAGMLGRTIAEQLAQSGASVRLVTRSGAAQVSGVQTMAADISDRTAAIKAANGADVLYFCAAPAYQDWERSFMPLQEGAIAAARESGAVLVAAENLYGYGAGGRLTERLPLSATTRKGAVRARMSRRLFDAHERGEIRAVSGRASDFFGPGVRQSALGERFWPNLVGGRTVDWLGDPDKRHTFTYLPDFARALILLGQTEGAYGRAWHVPSPETLTLRQVATDAARLAGMPAPKIRRTPRIMLRLAGLAIPAAREMIEMEYSFTDDFVMSHDGWLEHFEESATPWPVALQATLASWSKDSDGPVSIVA